MPAPTISARLAIASSDAPASPAPSLDTAANRGEPG